MKKIRLLVIDDEPQVTRVFALLLSRFGFEVLQVNDPTQAVAAGLKFAPDIIFSDVDMPGLDGGELAAQFSAALPQPTPLVFLTSLVKPSEVSRGHRLFGGFPFIAKPINVQQVLACIRDQMQPGRALEHGALLPLSR